MSEKTYTQSPWDLSDLFTGVDDPKINATFEEINQGLETFEAYRDQLTPDISEDLFRKIIKEYESFFRLMLRVGGFAELKFASDTQDQNAQGWSPR